MKNTNDIIEEILTQNKEVLGKDFETYRNHVYRIFNICLQLDSENQEKYAIAAVFHDIGIWTANTFDYLEPSIALAHAYLKRTNQLEWKAEIGLMIDMHHKISKYTGNYEKTVEIFRRADWMDVTMGIKRFGFSRSEYSSITKNHPTMGFHKFLILQTLKNLFKPPLNPLPMFKR